MDASLKHLRAFIAVAKAGGFTPAAQALRIAQPTLTVHIRQLEEALAVRLFDRTSRTVGLTRIGRELLPVLERMIEDLDTVISGVRDLADETRGIVRLAALPSFTADPLPAAIEAFRASHPGVSFHIHDVVAGRGVEMIRAEEVDLAVLGGHTFAPDIEVLGRRPERMIALCPPDHAIAGRVGLQAEDLAAYPLVLMRPETSVRAVTDRAFEHARLAVQVAVEVTYIMSAVAMVKAGLGIAILPETARERHAEPSLTATLIDDARFSRQAGLVRHVGRTIPPASDAFAQHLVKNYFHDRTVQECGI